jgi:transposase-like protein
MDESFIGGKIKNMHKSKKPIGTGFTGKATGGMAKAIVVGMLERGGRVKAEVVAERATHVLQDLIKAHIDESATLITDELPAYNKTKLVHEVINHANEYVRGHVHTNGIENFWTLLKRGLTGTYIAVEPFHLQAYVAEQVFRFNNRKDMNDGARFVKVLSQIVGKRLTYAELTGRLPQSV